MISARYVLISRLSFVKRAALPTVTTMDSREYVWELRIGMHERLATAQSVWRSFLKSAWPRACNVTSLNVEHGPASRFVASDAEHKAQGYPKWVSCILEAELPSQSR